MLAPDSPVTVGVVATCGVGLQVLAARLGFRLRAVVPVLTGAVLLVVAGALWVNVAYDYYLTWGDVVADARGSSDGPVAAPGTGTQTDRPSAPAAGGRVSPGRLEQLTLAGPSSGLSRLAVVWLPAGYDDPGQAPRRYPVMMLLHGDPGEARGFVYGMHVDRAVAELQRRGLPPFVIVMPTTWRGWHGQQCLDAVRGGPRDETYLVRDVPAALGAAVRVLPPGRAWAVAGLSEGGYCALDLALRHPDRFAGAAALDGYGAPDVSRGVGSRLFAGDAALQRAATPQLTIAGRRHQPPLWLMAGDRDAYDLGQAQALAALAAGRAPVRLVVVHGGRHTTPSWRTALPDLLSWCGRLVTGASAPSGRLDLPVETP